MLARGERFRPLRINTSAFFRREHKVVNPRPPPPLNPTLATRLNELTRRSTHVCKTKHTSAIFNTAITQIRQASLGDIGEIARCWVYLKQFNLLQQLDTQELVYISSLLSGEFLPPKGDPNLLYFHNKSIVEEIAIHSTARKVPDLMITTMVCYLQLKKPAEVLRLYNEFRRTINQNNTPSQLPETRLTPETFSPMPNSTADDTLSPGADILPYVIIAHAHQNAFTDALNACVRANLKPLSLNNMQFCLTRLNLDEATQAKAKVYADRIALACLLNQPQALSKRLSDYTGSNHEAQVEVLYRDVLQELSSPDSFITPDSSKKSPQQPIAITEITWTAFVVAFLKCGRQDLSAQIWDDMANFGVAPGISMWTALLDTYNGLRQSDHAIKAWEMLHAQGLKPDALTYRALISTLFHENRVDDAMHYFDSFTQVLSRKCTKEQLLSVHNTVVNGLLSRDRHEKAVQFMEDMRTHGPSPDTVTYNTFLTYYSRKSNFAMLAKSVNEMMKNGVQGDVFTFSPILSAFLKAGREDAPQMMIRLMAKQGVQPNHAIYTAIIDNQMREMNERNLQAALDLLGRMEQDPNAQPNEVTYTAIIAGLHRGQWLEPATAEVHTRSIMERMKRRGVACKLPAYHILLKVFLDFPHPSGLEKAQFFYREMRSQKLPFSHTTWYILLAGHLHRGEWHLAQKIMVDMYRTGFHPDHKIEQLVTRIKKWKEA